MPRAVRFDDYGGIEVLHVSDVPAPEPGTGEVLVRVRAAGVNPGEAMIRSGAFHDRFPATFPSGQGSDLAGVVEAVGAGVEAFAPGDEVLGFTHGRASQAELVVTEAEHLTAKPAAVPWEVAGSLFVAGSTAWAAVRAVAPGPGDTVVVAGATGGVGSLAVQLARAQGATVVGVASAANHDWLRAHGVVPVAYGEDVREALLAACGGRAPDALVDCFGGGYVALALSLGVPRERINTIIDFAAVEEHGVRSDGNMEGGRAEVLAELAARIAGGELDVPIAATYPLEEVQEAYRRVEERHTRGKIVLVP